MLDMANISCSQRIECASKFICKDTCPFKERIKQADIPIELLLLVNHI
jgi:hypothetical protein